MRARIPTAALAASALIWLTGCSGGLPSLPRIDDLNPFAEKQVPLPGKRIAVLQSGDKMGGAELDGAVKPIALPAAFDLDAWTQPGGTPNNAPGHLSFDGTANRAWSADAGSGSSSSGRLTASPVVYGGRVYTLDTTGRLTAFSATGGSSVWRVALAPPEEQNKAGYGGGLAVDGGRLYAATGFGYVTAIDPQSGKKLWEKRLGAPIRSSPTAAGDRVFVVASDGTVTCLAGGDGTELWKHRGLSETASLIFNPSPAVDGEAVVVPFPNGDIIALRIADGATLWTENLAASAAASSLAAMSDAGRPAIAGGVVYAIGHSGRMIATQLKTGERIWSLTIPGTQTPWVAGEAVFVVDTQGQLSAIDRREGRLLWTAKLPGGSNWSGPTLAGGLLWLGSGQGKLVAVEAATGRVASQQDVGGPVYIAPVVAGGRLYVLTDKAQLVAYN